VRRSLIFWHPAFADDDGSTTQAALVQAEAQAEVATSTAAAAAALASLAKGRVHPMVVNTPANAAVIKDTSLLAPVGVAELVYKGEIVIAAIFASFAIWSVVALLYFRFAGDDRPLPGLGGGVLSPEASVGHHHLWLCHWRVFEPQAGTGDL
jgi:hypothetical protein